MADNRSPASPETARLETSARSRPLRDFLIGTSVAGLISIIYLSLSADMTSGAAVGNSQWVVAIAFPVLCGALSAIGGRSVAQLFARLLDNLPPLPF